jgi:hypothetical protein
MTESIAIPDMFFAEWARGSYSDQLPDDKNLEWRVEGRTNRIRGCDLHKI